MSLGTKGFLQYALGVLLVVTALLLMVPMAADFWFPSPHLARFEKDGTFTVWDTVNMGDRGFTYYFVLALFGGVILIKLGHLLLMWGNHNQKLAENPPRSPLTKRPL